jgi:hypothetical protein
LLVVFLLFVVAEKPNGGQTRKHCFQAMFPEGGQTRKHCFLAMFPEGGQTRKHCFLAMFPESGQTRIQRHKNQDQSLGITTFYYKFYLQRPTN